jgi:hypothetical protein
MITIASYRRESGRLNLLGFFNRGLRQPSARISRWDPPTHRLSSFSADECCIKDIILYRNTAGQGNVRRDRTADGDNEPILCLFPVRVDQYPQSAAGEFKSEILPKMKEWLDRELTRSETAVVGLDECFAVEWTGDQHRCHQFRWR